MSSDETPIVPPDERNEANLEVYQGILDGVQDQIRFADSKAGFIAALNAVLFGFLSSNISTLRLLESNTLEYTWGICLTKALLVLYVVTTFVSFTFVVRAVMSRFGELAPQTDVFFGHIVKMYGTDYAAYVRTTIGYNDRQWAQQIGTQIVEVSHIALMKHRRVRKAAWCTLVACIFWIATLIAIVLLPTPKAGDQTPLNPSATGTAVKLCRYFPYFPCLIFVGSNLAAAFPTCKQTHGKR
jgi:hypothetical protein